MEHVQPVDEKEPEADQQIESEADQQVDTLQSELEIIQAPKDRAEI